MKKERTKNKETERKINVVKKRKKYEDIVKKTEKVFINGKKTTRNKMWDGK